MKCTLLGYKSSFWADREWYEELCTILQRDPIQAKVIEVAKDKIFDPAKTVNDIAYELGFKHHQHFSRFFKQRVGQAPNDYRS